MESEPQNYLYQHIFSVLKDEHENFLYSCCENESIYGNMKIVFRDRSVTYNQTLFILLNPEVKKLISSDTESDLVIIYPDLSSDDIFVKDNVFQTEEDNCIETNDLNFESENGYEDKVAQFFCVICSKSYSTKRKLQKHNYYLHPKSAAGVKTLKERNSNNASATAKDISEHKCQICGKIFKRAHNLKIHMNVHAMDPIERVQCAECTSTFSNHSSLNRHLRTVHNCQAPSIKCSYCDKEFQRRDNLMRHVSKFHTK